MPRVCTVCSHPQTLEIDRFLAKGDSYRTIARRFTVSESAIKRHVLKCIPIFLEAARAERKRERAIVVEAEVSRVFNRLNKLFDACDLWLTNPDDPALYSLDARAEELTVIYEDGNDLTPKGNPKRKRDKLSLLLRRLDGAGVETLSVTSKHADPRELIVKTAGEIQAKLELFARLQGLFQRDRANESDREHERALMARITAELQRLINAGWSEEDAKSIVLEAVPEAAKWLQ